MWFLIYWDRFGSVYIKKFRSLSSINKYVKKHFIKNYRIAQQLSIDLSKYAI